MKIVVITDETGKFELLQLVKQAGTDLVWQKDIAPVPGTDLCIDFLFDETRERAEQLRQTFHSPIAINAVIATL